MALRRQASVFSAGGALTAIGANITNLAAQNMTRLKIEAGEFTHYTVQSTAASAFQAGGALSVQSVGVVVNSGNLYGQAISIIGAGLTNGETNPAIAPIASITPNAVINLGDPSLGRGILDAQDIVTRATRQTVNGAATAAASFLNGSISGLATTAVVDSQYVLAPTLASITPQQVALAVQVQANSASFGLPQDANLTGELARHGEFIQPGIDLTQTANQRVDAMAPSAAAQVQYLNASPVSDVLAPLTPAYLLQQLPAELVNGSNLFFYADPYVEQQLLRKAALQQTGRSYFINGLAYDDQYQVSADTQQQAILYDQAAQFAKDNGIRLGQALSPELQAKLNAPMLWYVEQKVKHKSEDGSEQEITALVPQVYLPELYRQSLTNQAGGVIEGDDVSINVSGTVNNTGYLIAHNKLSITAQEFIQQHRQADIGRETENIEDGYVAITGTRLQPGGFAAGAEIELNVQRLQSIAGEFQVLGESLADSQAKTETLLTDLRNRFEAQFETQAQDNLYFEANVDKGVDIMQVVIIVVAIVITIYTAGAATPFLTAALGGSAVAGAAAGAAVGAMASSAFTGLATGTFSVKTVLKAGLIAGLTAGLATGFSTAAGFNGTAATFTERAVNIAGRSVISAGVNTAVNGGDFTTALTSSLIANASAGAANAIGNFEAGSFEHVASHALLGCATAAAQDQDCAAGAAGGAASAYLTSFIDDPVDGNGDRRAWTNAEQALITGGSALVSGLLAEAAGLDANTAITAAQNETQNNRLLHRNETQALRKKAQELAQQYPPEVRAQSQQYWYELLVSEAQAVVDAQAHERRETYLNQLGNVAADPAREGQFYFDRYTQDIVAARQIVAAMAGAPILGDAGRAILADGEALRMFQAGPNQYQDNQLFAPGTADWLKDQQFRGSPTRWEFAGYTESQMANGGINQVIDSRDNARLERYAARNGGAEISIPELDLLGLGGAARGIGSLIAGRIAAAKLSQTEILSLGRGPITQEAATRFGGYGSVTSGNPATSAGKIVAGTGDDAGAALRTLPEIEVNGVTVKPVDIRFGDPGKVAIIARGMDAVDAYAAALRAKGVDVNLFSGKEFAIPTAARQEWDNIAARYGGSIPDDVLKSSKMFQTDEAWTQLLVHENYTVINLGNPFSQGEFALPRSSSEINKLI